MIPFPCPTHQELERLLDEQLGPAEVRRISDHVASCPDCQQALESLTTDQEFRAVLDRLQKHD